MKNNTIIRNTGSLELRYLDDNSESRTVFGYAIIFDSPSQDMGFIETIKRGAIDQTLVDNCDVFAKFNHYDDKVLARSNKGKGSLRLLVDDKGLYYEFEAPNTDLGDQLLENIRRGEIYQSSFAFALNPKDKNAQKWEKRDGKMYRTINKIGYLFDISPVWTPAYIATSVDKRDLEDAEKKIQELEEKYNNMLEELNKFKI